MSGSTIDNVDHICHKAFSPLLKNPYLVKVDKQAQEPWEDLDFLKTYLIYLKIIRIHSVFYQPNLNRLKKKFRSRVVLEHTPCQLKQVLVVVTNHHPPMEW
jgi:hypothetical protein